MPFAGTSDEFDRFAALQRVQFLADPTGRRHEGDETRLVALEPAGATVLMRLPPVRLSVERGQTGGIFTLPICGHTPMPPFRGSSAFQERLFVVAMFFYSLSSLRVPWWLGRTLSPGLSDRGWSRSRSSPWSDSAGLWSKRRNHPTWSVYGQINVYSVTTKSERYERSYWTRTAAGNGIGGRKAPVPYGS